MLAFYRSRWNLSRKKPGIKVVAGCKKLLYKEESSIPVLQRVYFNILYFTNNIIN